MKEPKKITVSRTTSITYLVADVAEQYLEDNDEKPDFDDIMEKIIEDSDEFFDEYAGGERKFTDEDGNEIDMIPYGIPQ